VLLLHDALGSLETLVVHPAPEGGTIVTLTVEVPGRDFDLIRAEVHHARDIVIDGDVHLSTPIDRDRSRSGASYSRPPGLAPDARTVGQSAALTLS
jgi:hypothetical protein